MIELSAPSLPFTRSNFLILFSNRKEIKQKFKKKKKKRPLHLHSNPIIISISISSLFCHFFIRVDWAKDQGPRTELDQASDDYDDHHLPTRSYVENSTMENVGRPTDAQRLRIAIVEIPLFA